jgi:hypothetical protein
MVPMKSSSVGEISSLRRGRAIAIPTTYSDRELAEPGGPMSYGISGPWVLVGLGIYISAEPF